jgi:hypothetical protein
MPDEPIAPEITLETWAGPWSADDPDANFKADIALYSLVDPLATIRSLSGAIGVPIGALCRYVLAKWATEGSGGLLEIGPRMTNGSPQCAHRLRTPEPTKPVSLRTNNSARCSTGCRHRLTNPMCIERSVENATRSIEENETRVSELKLSNAVTVANARL